MTGSVFYLNVTGFCKSSKIALSLLLVMTVK